MIALQTKAEKKNTFKLPVGTALRRELRTIFREQRLAILRYLQKGFKSFEDELEQKDEQEPSHPHGGQLPATWPTLDAFKLGALAISQRIVPMIQAVWDRAGQQFTTHVGLDPNSWSVTNPHIADKIRQSALKLSHETNATTSMELDEALAKTRQALHSGLVDEGETGPQLTKRVNAIFDKAEKWRAKRIAMTEASRARHAAEEEAGKASGVVTGWRWLASADACPEICLAIVARAPTVKLGEPFAIIGDNPTYSHIYHPPAHPNCQCTMVPVLTTEPTPAFHPPAVQPEPATDEEIDKVAEQQIALQESIFPPKKKPAPAIAKKPPLPTFGPSKAKIIEPSGNASNVASKIIGKDVSLQDVASVSGATEDSTVEIDSLDDPDNPELSYVSLIVTGPRYHSSRDIRRDEEGNPYITAGTFFVKPELQRQGIGREAFGRTVETGSKLGLQYIVATGIRSDIPGDKGIGYWVWPLMGYDGELSPLTLNRIKAAVSTGALPKRLVSAKKISDLYTMQEGINWWKVNGETIDLTFDLKPNSYSRRTWEAYLRSKQQA